MASPEHLKILKLGVEVWNKWREENRGVKVDLTGADLRDANLRRADLYTANLTGADLYEANLKYANLHGAGLSGANLSKTDLFKASLSGAILFRADLFEASLTGADLYEADLYEADLTGADLSGAILSEANLSEANLSETDLSSADLTGAKLSGTKLQSATFNKTLLVDIDLSNVENLEKAGHRGSSYIDINTIIRSKENIPKSFLRGIGLPDSFIEYISTLTNQTFQYYSCFISYSNKDQGFADRLYADLQNMGVRCWFAPEDMKIGDKIRDRIDQSIRVHDKLLLVLSKNSINSEWVEDEVEAAYEQEQSRGTTVLFPIRLDNAVMDTKKAWAAKLRRSRHIGDFTNWKDHDSYQNAFDRLLKDLKTERE